MLPLRSLAPFALALAVSLPAAASAQSFTDAQLKDIETVVRDYLIAHPEVLEEASAELGRRQAVAEVTKQQAAVQKHADALFNSPHGVVLGNPKGDVNFVEFFDYNCGYCKRALGDMLDLMKSDPNLRVTLKEFPVLSPGSVEAARVAIAVHMQDPSGKKYLEFHKNLLTGHGQADKARALAAAKEAGADMARLEKDLSNPQINEILKENFKIAEDMGLTGTPSYVIGKDVVVGAVGLADLTKKVAQARCGKDAC
jgi:protein-disulfide isomerase